MEEQKPVGERQEPFRVKPWMWVCLIVGALLTVFSFDPVGDGIVTMFGEGADRWAINLIIIGLIVYIYFAEKKK